MKKETINLLRIQIGDKFIVNNDNEYVFKRFISKDIGNKNNQIVKDNVELEHMLSVPFSYYNPKIGEIFEIVALGKLLTPGHSDSKKFTIKINNNYYSTQWKTLKDLTRKL